MTVESQPFDLDEIFDEGLEEFADYLPATAENKPEYTAFDISSKQFWQKNAVERQKVFKQLRDADPISWQRPVQDAVTPDPDDPGYWAVVRHADIAQVSRDHHTFISGQGVLMDLLPPVLLEMVQSFIAMDNPRHDKLRSLVSVAFTPKQIRRIEDQITAAAEKIVDDIAGRGEIEAVSELAARLPAQVLCDMFGVPEHLRARTIAAASDLVAWCDEETLAGRQADELQIEASLELHEIALEMIEARRREPTDDLCTSLVQAEVDGERMRDFDIQAFFVLMAAAGTDSTRNTTSHALMALSANPDQRDWLREDLDGRIGLAVNEFIRFATPVMNMRRTVSVQTELGGRVMMPGDKVVVFYESGNNDETVFEHPERFDLARDPNPHQGFGGGGIHFCLGNQLAQSMLRALFRQVLTRIPDFEAGAPDLMGTNFMHGVKRLPLRFTPEH